MAPQSNEERPTRAKKDWNKPALKEVDLEATRQGIIGTINDLTNSTGTTS